jgi:hypothetical protein
MAFIDDYQYEQYSQVFDCADGDHRVQIKKVEVKKAKSGSNMLEIQFAVEGGNGIPYYERYVEGEFFNKNMSRFFDAFKLQQNNFQFDSWMMKIATGHFVHEKEQYEDSSGQMRETNRSRLKYLVVPGNGQQQRPAPQYRTPSYQNRQPVQSNQPDFNTGMPNNEDIPF